jgi:hypothetical protein
MPKPPKSRQFSPYENIVIGNFLYGLGLSLGTRAGLKAPLASINNTQQTPLDPILADVWLTFPGVCRLLEFKRQGVDNTKDREKRMALSAILNDQQDLIPVSRRIHWFAEITGQLDHGVDLSICPYLDFTDRVMQRLTLSQYVGQLAESAIRPGADEPSAAAVSAYLRQLGELSDIGTASTGGLMVHVAQDGRVRYLPLADLRELNLHLRQEVALYDRLSHEVEQQRDKDHELTLEMKPTQRGWKR